MNISKNTWHFGVVADDFFFMEGWYPSRSLCLYFWQVVIRLFFGISIGLLAASPLSTIINYATDTLRSSPFLVEFYSFIGFLVGCFYLFVAVIFILACVVQAVKWVNSKFPRKHIEPKEPKEPSIIIEYIKAKKAKVCPMLNFTD
jgi:hypothetical protein